MERDHEPGQTAARTIRGTSLIPELVLASGNPHKVKEISLMLADLGVVVRPLDEFPGAPEVIEDGASYEENAVKKARSAAVFTGKPALADDTGLEVEALDSRPGIYSARFAGEECTFEDNVKKLLGLLEGMPAERRAARFVCVMALVTPEGREDVVCGELAGRIAETPSGADGFGYDPVFFVPEIGKTLAELSPAQKNLLSHRAQALKKARELLRREIIGA
jgi:XTP/dITP diphosphohydrolase